MGRGLIVGLTGGIACGKSEVGRLLEEEGVAVLDTDLVARDLVKPGSAEHDKVVERFGPAILDPNGWIDRSRLGRMVFADADQRASLNEIVHPGVMDRVARWIDEGKSEGRVGVVIVPLLFEIGAEGSFDVVICVAASPDVVMDRLYRRGLTQREAVMRVRAQMGVDTKRARADYVIENDGSIAELREKTMEIWTDMMKTERKRHG